MSLKYQKNAEGHFICSHCPYTAKNQSTMHYHLKKHDGALPHACKHCNQKFLQKSLLDLHTSARHPNACGHCNHKEFEYKAQLDTHIVTTHTNVVAKDVKEKFKCPCNSCGYEDLRKGNRLIHFIRVHLKEYTDSLKVKSVEPNCITSCKSCKKSFKSMTQFYYHASNCVIPPQENHALYKDWLAVKV